MILIDFTQIAIGGLMTQMHRGNDELDEKLVRHVVLNTLRYYRSRFNEKYGELVICCDSKHYWRRDFFPNYKANRKKDREKSEYDWNEIFTLLNQIKDEIKKNFPYKVIEIYGAEADDIIATLVKHEPKWDTNKNLIISSDKDFIQLHGNNVEQYSPVSKKIVNGKDPLKYLREHIIKGDRSDGVPNILSPDDTFVESKRQKPIRKTVIAELLEQMIRFEPKKLYVLAKCPKDTWIRNWQRNETLINLDKIPTDIQDEILREFKNVKEKDRSDLLNYFIKNGLNNLVENIGDF
jgi:5'-3' exonuclease